MLRKTSLGKTYKNISHKRKWKTSLGKMFFERDFFIAASYYVSLLRYHTLSYLEQVWDYFKHELVFIANLVHPTIDSSWTRTSFSNYGWTASGGRWWCVFLVMNHSFFNILCPYSTLCHGNHLAAWHAFQLIVSIVLGKNISDKTKASISEARLGIFHSMHVYYSHV